MSLSFIDDIREYYYEHLEKLETSKQFHFASRLSAWNGDPRAYDILRRTQSYLLKVETSSEQISTIGKLLNKEQSGRRNAHELRLPFFEKYPDLYGLELAIFRVRHLKYIYNIDIRNDLFALYPKEKINTLKDTIINDKEAVKYLSTFAINFCYLTDIVLNDTRPSFDIEQIYTIGLTYDTNITEEVQLLLYLYTHCIIAETNFYVDPLPVTHRSTYLKMIEKAEDVIREKFDLITLDNKLEFLVAARICNYESALAEAIYAECKRSISHEGMFIVDKHNKNIRPERQKFEKSEHRNVLLIMSNSPYSPHKIAV